MQKSFAFITALIFTMHLISAAPVQENNKENSGKLPLLTSSALISDEKKEISSFYFNNNNGEEPVTGFDFGIHYFPGTLFVGGADMNLGSEVRIYDEAQWVDEENLPEDIFMDARRDYGDEISPVITSHSPEVPIMLNLGYTHNDTRIGLTWMRVSSSHDQSGELPGFYLYEDQNEEFFGYAFVDFWNMGWDLHQSRGFPAIWYEGFRELDEEPNNENNDAPPYEITFYPEEGGTQWRVYHETSLNSLQFNVKHPVIKNDDLVARLIGGIHYGRWSDALGQLMEITAHISMTDKWSEKVWDEAAEDSIMADFYLESIFHNDITLETESSVTFNPLGTMIGVEAEWQLTPGLLFSVAAHGSALRGEASFEGMGTDVDDIVERGRLSVYDKDDQLIGSATVSGYEYLSGTFDLPETKKSLTATNYGLDVKARYRITDVFSVTAGYYYSLWKDMPMSPQWTYSDEYTEPYGAFAVEGSWKTDIKSDISNSGFRIGVNVGF